MCCTYLSKYPLCCLIFISPLHVSPAVCLPYPPTTPSDVVLPNSNGSNGWDPSTISQVVFSAIMVFIGLVAIWQARRFHPAHGIPADDNDSMSSMSCIET